MPKVFLKGALVMWGGGWSERPRPGEAVHLGPPEGCAESHWEALCLLLIVLFGVACC